ncbi:glycoside hydrolase family 20 zincin-like fold domain-containing protein [Cellulomonas marina]|uniref:beta-N-acetylhexosaminidase n=1 Tax=Cellulomonas marina TaxID=988821 RepID=A0A1I0X6T3_9CELL|nr:glycoside hydrolase family 20 zincin-like fold domain-containing protein [Cellulomonas marina]GIG28956.1 hypothetical protein Cma02nite_15560 [Cellulomonas marina]SFA96106.1 Glycosyl hydrolase family 20, domain 2 [Cellulomonas marina]
MTGTAAGAASAAGGGGAGAPGVLPVPAMVRPLAGAGFALSSATRVVVADDPGTVAVGTLWAGALVAAGGRDVGLDVAGHGPGSRVPAAGAVVLELVDDLPADGSYRLVTDARRVRVAAASRDGLVHALATVRQLLRRGPAGTAVVPAVEVEDRPVLGWRALALDVRAGVPDLATMQHLVELLALHKLDVLHLRLAVWPRGPAAGEWATLVALADARGISVLPEVDGPDDGAASGRPAAPAGTDAPGDDARHGGPAGPEALAAAGGWGHAGESGPGLAPRLHRLAAAGVEPVVRAVPGVVPGPLPPGALVEVPVGPGFSAAVDLAAVPADAAGVLLRVPLDRARWEDLLAFDPLAAAGAAADRVVGVVGALPGPAPRDLHGLTAALLPALPVLAALAWDPAVVRDPEGVRRRLAAQPPLWRRLGLPVAALVGRAEPGRPAR